MRTGRIEAKASAEYAGQRIQYPAPVPKANFGLLRMGVHVDVFDGQSEGHDAARVVAPRQPVAVRKRHRVSDAPVDDGSVVDVEEQMARPRASGFRRAQDGVQRKPVAFSHHLVERQVAEGLDGARPQARHRGEGSGRAALRRRLQAKLWVDQGSSLANLHDLRGFGLARAEELLSRGDVVEEVFDFHRRASRAAARFDARHPSSLDHDPGSLRVVGSPGGDGHSGDGANGGKGLSAKAEGLHAHQIVKRANLARGVARDGEFRVGPRHPDPVVADADERPAAVLDRDPDGGGFRVDGVLDEFFDQIGGSFDDLARRDLVDERAVQHLHRGAHEVRLSNVARLGNEPQGFVGLGGVEGLSSVWPHRIGFATVRAERGSSESVNKVCPTCRLQYGGGEVFCPVDASRLVSSSQVGGKPRDPDDPLIGTLLAGRYEVIRRIGEGGMGLVYEGRHRDIDKPVAIKVLRDDLSGRPEVVARFRQEAKSASRIGHENIVNVSDFGETQFGASYFVMEHLEGEDLANVLGREATLDPDRTCRIVLQCCRALGAAHDKRIVHRDIKPENVFLTTRDDTREFVKIVDFGIAKMGDIETEGQPGRKLTKTGMIFGTPEYMSPEQAAGKQLDHRVDIYALGIILYECLAGTVPFVGDTFMGVLTQHLFATPPRILENNPQAHVSPELELVINKALAKDPNDRYQDTAELAEAIECALEGRLSAATAESAAVSDPIALIETDPAPPPTRKRRWLVGVAATGVLAMAALGMGLATSGPGAEAGQADPSPESESAEATAGVPVAPGDVPSGAAVAAPTLVDLHVASKPAGAAVVHADGTPACEATPCTLAVARGTPLVLRARLGKRSGRARINPTQEETVLIELKAPRKPNPKPRKSAEARPRRDGNSPNRASDLKVPEWAR